MHIGACRSPWALIRSWTLARNLWDLLHLLWLGFVKDLLAAELYLTALEEFPNLDLDVSLGLLWDEMRLTNKLLRRDCKTKRWNTNTISWEGNKDYPTLASAIKGADCKAIFMWVSRRSAQRFDASTASPLQRLRATALWSLRKFVDTCDHASLFLTEAEASDACWCGWVFLRAYQRMACVCKAQKLCLFKLRSKLHYFAHLLLDLRRSRENPSRYQLFIQEDYMQRVKLLGKALHAKGMEKTIAHRWCIFFAHRWHCKTQQRRFRRPFLGRKVRKHLVK